MADQVRDAAARLRAPLALRRETLSWLMMVNAIVLVAIAIVPVAAFLMGKPFWLDIATRLVILAIAASSLSLLLGVAGLPSFGHAAFIGIGAYAVGIPAYHATYGEFDSIASYSGFFHLFMALLVSGLFALVTGAISLRTRGVHFIMITMAFAQMAFYFFVSINTYGGDDGLTIDIRSEFPGFSLDNPLTLFGIAYVSLLGVLYGIHRIGASRFGMVLRGARTNEARMEALGFNPYIYRLVVYVIAGMICGYAGVLMGNFSTFISPDMMEWTRSGELLFMVILGGSASVAGPVLGATAFMLLEEILSHFTIHWKLPFGIILIASVLLVRGGISGFLAGRGSVSSGESRDG